MRLPFIDHFVRDLQHVYTGIYSIDHQRNHYDSFSQLFSTLPLKIWS